MTRNNREIEESFDARLHRVLGAHAQAAPMPPAVVEIPDSWTRERRRLPIGAAARILGAATAAIVLVAVVTQLPGIGLFGARPVDARAAAAFLGVPRQHVVETRDGAVAIRQIPGTERTVEVVLVTRVESALEMHQLARIVIPLGAPRDIHFWAEPISCSRETRLQQPNILVGGSDPPAAAARVGNRDVPTHGGLFVTALETVDFGYDEVLSVVWSGVGPAERSELHLTGASFGRTDACTGELRTP